MGHSHGLFETFNPLPSERRMENESSAPPAILVGLYSCDKACTQCRDSTGNCAMEASQIKEIPLNVSFFFSISHFIKKIQHKEKLKAALLTYLGFSASWSPPALHTVTTRVVLWPCPTLAAVTAMGTARCRHAFGMLLSPAPTKSTGREILSNGKPAFHQAIARDSSCGNKS